MITLGFQGKKYGVRYDDKGNYYITDPVQGYRVLALDVQTFEDGKKSLQIVTKWSQSSEMQTLHLAFTQGRLFFKNIKIKILFLKYMQFMI